MSLINEALKRARQESRRREALAKGLPLAPPPRSASPRSWMVAAVVVMALALLVSLVTIARLATKEPTTSASVVASSDDHDTHREAGEPEPSTLTDTSIETIATTVPVPEPRGSLARLQASVAENAPPPPISEELLQGSTKLPDPPLEGVSLSPGTRNPGAEDSPGNSSPQARVFVERATLASGDTLELGGIAWSQTGPYALLDERVVGLGESVMGYLVTRIAPQEVELEGSDGTILIRLK